MTSKIFIITLLIITSAKTIFSQAKDCSALKFENEKIKQENEYLKKTLNILQPVKSLVQNEVELKIAKIEGSIKDQTVTILLYITNHKANDYFQFGKVKAIDIQGKEYVRDQINFGSSLARNKLFTDTPLEVKIKFSKVLPTTKIFKLLYIESYKIGVFDSGNFEYRDLEINWK